jgi:predicted metal-dependent hydrolase
MTEIPYTIRRSTRARRIRVTVDATRGVQVVLPRRVAEREATVA